MGYRVGHGLYSNKGPLKRCGEMDPLDSLTIVRRTRSHLGHRICTRWTRGNLTLVAAKVIFWETQSLAETLASTGYSTEYDTESADG